MKKIKILLFICFHSFFCFSQNIIQEKDILGEDLSFENSFYTEGVRKYAFGDFKGAILDFNKAIKISPNEEYIYANRADAKFALEDYRGAIADYNSSIQIKPTSYSYNNRGISKFKLGDYRGAIMDYDLAIIELENVIDNSSKEFDRFDKEEKAKILCNKGNSKFMLRDYSGAINEYNLALNVFEIDYIFFNRGLSKLKLNQKDSGCLDLSKSGELGLHQSYDMIKTYCN